MVAWRDTQDRIPYPERRLPNALRRAPRGIPALAASRLAASRAFTIAHVMDFLVSSLLDGRHPAARFAHVGKKVTRVAVGPPAYMHAPATDPEHAPDPCAYPHAGWLQHGWVPQTATAPAPPGANLMRGRGNRRSPQGPRTAQRHGRARRCPSSTRAFTAASICWAVSSL